jgi:hypothetical protein
MAGSVPPILQQWFDAWNSGDPATNLPPLYTDDGVYEDVPTDARGTGTTGIHDFLAAFLGGIGDLKIEVQSAFGTDAWAAAEYWFGATDRGFIPAVRARAFACAR